MTPAVTATAAAPTATVPSGLWAVQAAITPETFDPETRRAGVVFSSGMPILRMGMFAGLVSVDRPFVEITGRESTEADLSRFASGRAPVLQDHIQALDFQHGRIVTAQSVPGGGAFGQTIIAGEVEFGEREVTREFLVEIQAGRMGSGSMGYVPLQLRPATAEEIALAQRMDPVLMESAAAQGLPVLVTSRWIGHEWSILSVPADNGVAVQAAAPGFGTHTLTLCGAARQLIMDPEETTEEPEEPAAVEETPVGEGGAAEGPEEQGGGGESPARAAEQGGGAATATADPPRRATQGGGNLSGAEVSELYELGAMAGLAVQEIAPIAAQATDAAVARGRILAIRRDRTNESNPGAPPPETATPGLRVVRERADNVFQGLEEALDFRSGVAGDPSRLRRGQEVHPEPSDMARPYVHCSLLQMAGESLRVLGIRRNPHLLPPQEIAALALQATTGGTTRSDFPKILENSLGKSMLQAYRLAGDEWKTFSRQRNARDFRPQKRIRLHNAGAMLAKVEDGEFKAAHFKESRESYSVSTFGNTVGVTRQMIVDDDLNAFVEIAPQFGQMASYTENATVWPLLTTPVNLEDGLPLYHASRNNIGAGVALSQAAVSAARAAMRQQKNLGGAYVSNAPRILACADSLHLAARQLVTETTPAAAQDVQVFSRGADALSAVVTSPFLEAQSATVWYLFADPRVTPTIEHAYLAGQNGPVLERQTGVLMDGVLLVVRHDFGAGAVDYVGTYYDPGF